MEKYHKTINDILQRKYRRMKYITMNEKYIIKYLDKYQGQIHQTQITYDKRKPYGKQS